MPQDYKKNVDWIFGAYENAGITLPDGFQKDAIQNAVGARKNDSWKNWKCKISVERNVKGTFIIIEDEGTEGFTGPNMEVSEIQDMIDNSEIIDAEWRLARFSSRNVSGGIETGAGKYGVGKSVYSVSSEDYDYCFDSLRKDELYVANRNECGSIYPKAFEGTEAIEKIEEWTGLKPKETIGARIIIMNPKDEILASIESGDIIQYIQESWWISILRMEDNAGIYVNGKRVELPKKINYENEYELPNPEKYDEGYRVKHFGLYISKNGDNEWHGISYYRMGMKIGTVDVDDMPPRIKDKYWGYIEVDKEWEERLADIEDTIHYGVTKGKKRTIIYQNLKNYTNEKIRHLLVGWKYVKNKENEDKKLNETLKKLSSEIQSLFDEMGFEDLGKGPKKSDFDVRWKDIKYPIEGNERVENGDILSFGFRIINNYITEKKFEYRIDVISKKDNHVVTTIESGKIKVLSEKKTDKKYELKITSDVAERYEENRIVLVVKVIGSIKEKRKELPFFYEIDKPENIKREVILSLHSINFPREGSNRVNFGEVLSGISYQIQNNRVHSLDFQLNVSIHNGEDKTYPKILDVGEYEGHASSYEEVIIDTIPDLEFSHNIYEPYITAGCLELRARVIAKSDSGEYEKGDRITEYRYKIYLNKDDNHGKEDSFDPKTVNEPENFRRSWYKKYGNDRSIVINSGHPAYLAIQYEEEQQIEYIKQEMLKQYVMLYLAEGKFATFGDGKDIAEMELIDAANCIMDKIEEVYQKSIY
jgi:hypothetical protein